MWPQSNAVASLPQYYKIIAVELQPFCNAEIVHHHDFSMSVVAMKIRVVTGGISRMPPSLLCGLKMRLMRKPSVPGWGFNFKLFV